MNHGNGGAIEQIACEFAVRDAALVGVVATPVHRDAERSHVGVLIVVGGPQYRVGSHRQFHLLARDLARAGFPVMRFDFAGMGDSSGTAAAFDRRGDEIRAALDAFTRLVPSVTQFALWGLCDGASSAMIYAPTDARVTRLVVVNPWVRSDDGLARTQLKHHYGRNIADADFWRRLLTGRVRVVRALQEFVIAWFAARQRTGPANDETFQTRMARGWREFKGSTLLILSGDDITAREFQDETGCSADWRGLLDREAVDMRALPAADHTFSRAVWRDQVASWTSQWLSGHSVDSTAPAAVENA